MESSASFKKAMFFSLGLHAFLLLIMIARFEHRGPQLVVSNNDLKVIEAVALQDSPLIAPPTQVAEKPKISEPIKQQEEAKPQDDKKNPAPSAPEEQALKSPPPEKKLALPEPVKKPLPLKKPKKLMQKELAKQLLADLEKELTQQAKTKQKHIKKKFDQVLKAQSEKALQQFLKVGKQNAGQRSQHQSGVIDKYKALILQAISQQWVVPSHVNKHLSSELLIRLGPGGVVLAVDITRSSGDVLLDRSARTAVFKASPLPVPDDSASFEPFKQFVLKVKPENVMDHSGEPSFS